jgi:hypothetical protein
MELRYIPIEKYKLKAPKTIGFLLYLYGPMVTNFFVLGLIATLNPSVGPPRPILNKKTLDQIAKNTPFIKMGRNIIILIKSEFISIKLLNTDLSNSDNLYKPKGMNNIKKVKPIVYPMICLVVSLIL